MDLPFGGGAGRSGNVTVTVDIKINVFEGKGAITPDVIESVGDGDENGEAGLLKMTDVKKRTFTDFYLTPGKISIEFRMRVGTTLVMLRYASRRAREGWLLKAITYVKR